MADQQQQQEQLQRQQMILQSLLYLLSQTEQLPPLQNPQLTAPLIHLYPPGQSISTAQTILQTPQTPSTIAPSHTPSIYTQPYDFLPLTFESQSLLPQHSFSFQTPFALEPPAFSNANAPLLHSFIRSPTTSTNQSSFQHETETELTIDSRASSSSRVSPAPAPAPAPVSLNRPVPTIDSLLPFVHSPIVSPIQAASASASASARQSPIEAASNLSRKKTAFNSFVIYTLAHREALRRSDPFLSNRELTRRLAQEWALVEPLEKLQYKRLARDLTNIRAQASSTQALHSSVPPPLMHLEFGEGEDIFGFRKETE